jgi:hypothetical protein
MKTTVVLPATVLLCIGMIAYAPAQTAGPAESPTQFGLTESDAAAGIKDALVKGTSEGVDLVSKVDGYLGNPEIKIPLPPDAAAVESKLRTIGLGTQVDKVIVTMNRAAEDAARDAQPIFIAAIRKMTITDALAIVQGDSAAATSYLKKNTAADLAVQFQPSIKASLEKVNATKYWSDIISIYNQLPLVEKIDPNLTQYVTGKAIDGLFVMIAKEEASIRKDPLARTTEILKKVFGQ